MNVGELRKHLKRLNEDATIFIFQEDAESNVLLGALRDVCFLDLGDDDEGPDGAIFFKIAPLTALQFISYSPLFEDEEKTSENCEPGG